MEAPEGLTRATLTVHGIERTYWSAPPPGGDPGAAPLLLALHGAGGQGPGMASLSGLHRTGPAAGFVTVFPDGVGRVWNDRRGAPGLRRREGVDDVAFLAALVARAGSEGWARSAAVSLVGISNGALLAEHVARSALLPVAALGLVAGPATETARRATPQPRQAATVVIFAGTADPLIPYAGGPIGPLGRAAQRRGGSGTSRGLATAAEVVAAEWAAADGNSTGPVIESLAMPADDLPVTCLTWRGAPGHPEVVLYRIEGGGHTWPGGGQYLPERFVGRRVRGLDAGAVLLEHFRAGAAPAASGP